MKAKVIKCSVDTYWYNNRIGEEFDVIEMPNAYDGAIRVSHDNSSGYIMETDYTWDLSVQETPVRNKYSREIKPGVWVDIYDVLNAWKVTDPCLQHAAKKVLQAGDRGHKNRLEDLQDIVDSTQRAIEMHKEWNRD